MDGFYHKIAEILEVDALHPSDVLMDFPEWDSLSVLSAIAMISADYGLNLTAANLRSVDTVQALHDLVAGRCGK